MGIKVYSYVIGVVLLLMGLSYGFGRYMQPAKVETKIVTVQVEKTTVKDKTTTTTTKKPDGTVIVVENKDVETKTEEKTNTNSDTVTLAKKQNLHVSALFGIDLDNGLGRDIVYGAHISKDIIGPVSIGLWGMSNRSGGASLGISF